MVFVLSRMNDLYEAAPFYLWKFFVCHVIGFIAFKFQSCQSLSFKPLYFLGFLIKV